MNQWCEHKVTRRLRGSTFEWCEQCGVIIYYMKVGGVFKDVPEGILCDYRQQKDQIVLMEHHFETCEEHDFFQLTLEIEWCIVCGMVQNTIGDADEEMARKVFTW